MTSSSSPSIWRSVLGFFLNRPLVSIALVGLWIVFGWFSMPLGGRHQDSDSVSVDAIPDLGDNQQIVLSRWPGHSPQEVDDQIGFPLSNALMGLPGVRSVRSSSSFGRSNIQVVFEQDVEFFWSRTRILEALASMPAQSLPPGVNPTLGPAATALGQVYWYTLEGLDESGKVVGGWDLHELRSIQDWTLKYALQSVDGVAEVASIGGHQLEYQVELNPRLLRAFDLDLEQVARALQRANRDSGGRSIEINKVEYLVRSIGQIRNRRDIEEIVVASREGRSLRVKELGQVKLGPASRRGSLDKDGSPAVGGIVTASFGENPMEVVSHLKSKIEHLQSTLPRRELENGVVSQLTIVPYYDRSLVVEESLSTLSTALAQQIVITVIVVLLVMGKVLASLLIALVLPAGVIIAFACMKLSGTEANIMSLAGIAIAIGSMVDMGIVLVENLSIRTKEYRSQKKWSAHGLQECVLSASHEVLPAVFTGLLTTLISFLPVFALEAAEGTLFTPLALTKSFGMLAAFFVVALVLPAIWFWLQLLDIQISSRLPQLGGARKWLDEYKDRSFAGPIRFLLALVASAWVLSLWWLPLGEAYSWWDNYLFLCGLFAILLLCIRIVLSEFQTLLSWALANKARFLLMPVLLLVFGGLSWRGSQSFSEVFPGLESEFMPDFDEGSFLFMPTTTAHASLGKAKEILSELDRRIAAIPEVKEAVGKLGRADTALDPAPISMFEILINYHSEYSLNESGQRVRNWRSHIRSPDDIWDEIVIASSMPGLTSAPKLMPIKTRLVMLQSGMRTPIGMKVRAPNAEQLDRAVERLGESLKHAPGLLPGSVYWEERDTKIYLELEVNRDALSAYGLDMEKVQKAFEGAVAGRGSGVIVQGRERNNLRVRYMREERDSPGKILDVLVRSSEGSLIPIRNLASIRFTPGPQVIRSEDGFLTSYILFERAEGISDSKAVALVSEYLEQEREGASLFLEQGTEYEFAGSYKDTQRAQERLLLLVPFVLLAIFLILKTQFRRTSTSIIVFSGILLAFAGGFFFLWLCGYQGLLGSRVGQFLIVDVFSISSPRLSIATWVGFIALAGIATDASVVMAHALENGVHRTLSVGESVFSIGQLRLLVAEIAQGRLKACLMTVSTTILALLPVLGSQGRGADVMRAMALPAFGGMIAIVLSLLVVPLLFCFVEELRFEE